MFVKRIVATLSLPVFNSSLSLLREKERDSNVFFVSSGTRESESIYSLLSTASMRGSIVIYPRNDFLFSTTCLFQTKRERTASLSNNPHNGLNKQTKSIAFPLLVLQCYSFSFSLSTYTGGGSKTDLPLLFVS